MQQRYRKVCAAREKQDNRLQAYTDFAYNTNILLAPEITLFGTHGDSEAFTVDATSQINGIFVLNIKEEESGENISNTILCVCPKDNKKSEKC